MTKPFSPYQLYAYGIMVLISTLLPLQTQAQDTLLGYYRTAFGDHLTLKEDSSFRYEWQVDVMRNWTEGIWKVKGDTLYLTPILVYDTLTKKSEFPKVSHYSLILSHDNIPQRLSSKEYAESLTYLPSQTASHLFSKLVYSKGKLIEVSNEGKLIKQKHRGIWTKRKYRPWYVKKAR